MVQAQHSTSAPQNVGLTVLVVGIFMVVLAFLAIIYFNSDKISTIKTNQSRNSQIGKVERSNLTDITCALWHSIGDPSRVKADLRAQVEEICTSATVSP